MNILDIIIAIPLLWALYRGFKKGLVYMIASITALVLGILGAMRFHERMGDILNGWFEINPQYQNLISFAVTFVLIVIVVHVAAFLVDKLIKAVALNFINRLAGMAFGVLLYAFIISIILMPVSAVNSKKAFISEETVEKSLLFVPLSKFAPAVFPYLKRAEFREWLPGDESNGEDVTDSNTEI